MPLCTKAQLFIYTVVTHPACKAVCALSCFLSAPAEQHSRTSQDATFLTTVKGRVNERDAARMSDLLVFGGNQHR